MSSKHLYYLSARGTGYPLALSTNYEDLKKLCDIHNDSDSIYDMSIGIINTEGGLASWEEYGPFKGPESIYSTGKKIPDRHRVDKYREIDTPPTNSRVFLLILNCFGGCDKHIPGECSRDDCIVLYDDVTEDSSSWMICVGEDKDDVVKKLNLPTCWERFYNIEEMEKKNEFYIWECDRTMKTSTSYWDFGIDF